MASDFNIRGRDIKIGAEGAVGQVTITNTTISTDPTSNAFVVDGGIGARRIAVGDAPSNYCYMAQTGTVAQVLSTGTLTVTGASNLNLNSSSGIVTVGDTSTTNDILLGPSQTTGDILVGQDVARTGDIILGSATNTGDITLGTSGVGTININGSTRFGDRATVTQITSVNTGVTINATVGKITTVSLTIPKWDKQTFTVTNDRVLADSIVLMTIEEYSGSNFFNVYVNNIVAGAFDVVLANSSNGTLDATATFAFKIL